MTSREDLLDQYIDSLNSGTAGDANSPDDHELRELFQVARQARVEAEIEWPEFDLPGEMSSSLVQQLGQTGSINVAIDDSTSDVETTSARSTGTSMPDDEQGGWRWYSRQFAGMVAAALVVISFGIGLAFILGDWGDGLHQPGALVEEGQIPGSILYAEYDGDQTIARIDADGTNQTDLATRSVPTFDRAGFAWSPDGQWIAYVDPDSGSRDAPAVVSLVRADGEQHETIEMEPIEGTQRLTAGLTWADDGDHLALEREHPDHERRQIVVVHRPSGEISPVLEPGDQPGNQSYPNWMPGSLTMVFSEGDADGQYRILIHDGNSEPVSLVEGSSRAIQPDWSPDGSSVVYVGPSEDSESGNVHVVDVSSGETTNITGHDARWDYVPTWSSRDQIAFMSDFGDRAYDVFVVNPDGSELRNVTENIEWHANIPDWSDDGRYLTFTTMSPDQDHWRINVYDIDEDHLYTVHESENPLFYAQWRPEGALDDTEDTTDPLDEADVDVAELTEEQLEVMRKSAELFLEGDDSPVAVTVDGEPITQARIERDRADVELRRSLMQEMIDDPEFDHPPVDRYNEAFIELIDEYGPENVGLGAALADIVVQQYAEEHDLEATDEQVEQAMEQQREAHDMVDEQDPEAAAAVGTALIDVIGEDRYWDEYLPEAMRQSMTEQNVNEAAWESAEIDPEPGTTFQLERERYLAEFRADLVREADIEIVEESALGDADLEQAIEYITESYPDLQQQRIDRQRELEEQSPDTP
jgi:Tol biopolymer transport system component